MFILNLSFIWHPCVLVAAIVVSDMNERLSPKNAPPITRAVMKGMLTSVFDAIPTATGTNATIVPTDVPIDNEMKHDARKIPASRRLSGNKCKVRLTVASMAPMALDDCQNAPAMMKIHIIIIMFLLAAPCEYCSILSFRLRPFVVATAYIVATMNATVIGTL